MIEDEIEKEIEKLKSEGILSDNPPIYIETQEEKEFSEYLKSIGIKNISLIGEKTMLPRLLINFNDDTMETYTFSNEEAQYLKNMENFDWKYCLNKSERLKNLI